MSIEPNNISFMFRFDTNTHLHKEWAQTTIHIEARYVLHLDASFALLGAHLQRCCLGSVRSPAMWDDLQQRHLGHWREVVHADDLFGSLGALSNVGDGDG